MGDQPELTCYVYPGWDPGLTPAPLPRDWMDLSPFNYAYRCLPLSIANAYGWHIGSPIGFSAFWNGSPAPDGVTIVPDRDAVGPRPVSIFGLGTLTWHTHGLIRTPPGHNLFVSGPANSFKDGIQALTGIIETDWSVMSFTMNWKFTRPNHTVRFSKGEPIAQVFPIRRGMVEEMRPVLRDVSDNPDLRRQYDTWTRGRDAFHAQVRRDPPRTQDDTWQKDYFKGLDMDGTKFPEHQAKVRMRPFQRD